jgi:hypothetical protein
MSDATRRARAAMPPRSGGDPRENHRFAAELRLAGALALSMLCCPQVGCDSSHSRQHTFS